MLIEKKKVRDKRFIKNWRPISLFNVDFKFLLGRGAHQDEQISAFLFISLLEILFLLIKTKPEIAGLTIFDHSTFTLHMLMIQLFSFFRLLQFKTKLIKM